MFTSELNANGFYNRSLPIRSTQPPLTRISFNLPVSTVFIWNCDLNIEYLAYLCYPILRYFKFIFDILVFFHFEYKS